ncbi:MAG: 1,4-alpha-glucan branching enzyme, partial [Chloroflexi bacterium]|nr:1,4-alpha-glucan branching enzyme [Chloroflexota bacterium]
FWLDEYHVDGLRVDAVASMLYLDYSRRPGEWEPNQYGGKEHLEAIAFLQQLNQEVAHRFPGCFLVAEESTAWPGVTHPVAQGGLGFAFKWNMGWMHDTLAYFSRDPIHRKWHHNVLTFPMMYASSESYILPLSHDEVVHGKGSLYAKMPGDHWQKLANLRALLGYMYAHPGKKLLFMGMELAQEQEWNYRASLDWHLLHEPQRAAFYQYVARLGHLYQGEPALWQQDHQPGGFSWLDPNDAESSVVSFLRWAKQDGDFIACVVNLTPIPRPGYRIGVPRPGLYREVLNSDDDAYGGGNVGNRGGRWAESLPWHNQPYSVSLTLPPLACLYLKLASHG